MELEQRLYALSANVIELTQVMQELTFAIKEKQQVDKEFQKEVLKRLKNFDSWGVGTSRDY